VGFGFLQMVTMASRAMMFPGQGAQKPGMAAEILSSVPAARAVFETASDVLGFDLLSLCLDGPEPELEKTDVCQPAILATSAAVIEALRAEKGLSPDSFSATAGLSLGEYTALWFAGSLTLEDALRLVRRRGQAMQRASDAQSSGMLSLVGATREQAEELASSVSGAGVIVAANYLGPGSIALSGATAALERAEGAARELGIRKTVRLKVAGAFHSPLMATAAEELRAALSDVPIAAPRVRFATNVTGAFVEDPEQIREYLARQVTSPVLWEDTMNLFVEQGIDTFVEPSPGRVLTGLLKKVARDSTRLNIDTKEDLLAYA